MYQFSLSSIDEVISTSNKVISDQNKYGVIIMPNNELGYQLKEIYTNTFQSMGGLIIDHQAYDPENQDFSEELKELLEDEEIMEIAMDMPFQWTLAEIRDPQSAYNNPNRQRSNPLRVAITEALKKLE